MRQVFLVADSDQPGNFENHDALPMSDRLLAELQARFKPAQDQNTFTVSVNEALSFLRDFYAHYELSQPQRRVYLRFEKILAGIPSVQMVQFAAAEVSEHRSRRNLNKNLKKN